MVQEHDDDLLVLQTTMPDENSADALAEAIIAAKLAACVQMSAIRSAYRWEGETERAAEVRLDIKTRTARLAALVALIRQHHPYDEPELIALPVAWASQSYADWVRAETT